MKNKFVIKLSILPYNSSVHSEEFCNEIHLDRTAGMEILLEFVSCGEKKITNFSKISNMQEKYIEMFTERLETHRNQSFRS